MFFIVVMHLAIQALKLSLQASHCDKGNKYLNKRNVVKNPIYIT